jgi:hypothetical protein
MRDFLNLVADIAILVAFGAAVVFVISYAVFFNWRRTAAGRALMYVFLSLVGATLLSGLGRWIGTDYWGREFIRPLIWGAVAVAVIRLVFVLWSNWRVERPSLDIESRARRKRDKT